MSSDVVPAETAYYYPEPYWFAGQGDWIKTLLLFFDEVAILLPRYMAGRNVAADPTLVEPLMERGLLRVLEPETFVDDTLTEQISDAIIALVKEGVFDSSGGDDDNFVELSMSRMGFGAAREMARDVVEELRRRDLAMESRDGVSIPLSAQVRVAYLVLLAQFAREAGLRRGLNLSPATDQDRVVGALSSLLEKEPMPSRGHVLTLDLQVAAVDLSAVPLDDVLAFRGDNHAAFRAYMTDLRSFTLELGLLDPADRAIALRGRQEELADQARDLRERTFKAWKSPKKVAGFALGITGAAWSVATGSPFPAALGTLGAGLGMIPEKSQANAYSYLFASHDAWPG